MTKTIKLSTLLAKTDHLGSPYQASIKDYIHFFKDKQGAFKGEKKTYAPRLGTIDLPSERGNRAVVTTVKEKLDWLRETNKEYIDALFSQEATNAANVAKAELFVDGISWGTLSSLELLRLKSVLENGQLEQMYASIPVRADDEEWTPTTQEQYGGREIFDGIETGGIRKSVTKEAYILVDPNVATLKDSSSYKPQVGTKDTVVELGEYTFQKFSGEWSHRQRAELLRRRTRLLSAVIEALKNANDVEVIASGVTADKIFGYLHS